MPKSEQTSIGLVTPSFHPMIGGVELYVKGVGRELAELGYDVHVYTPNSVMGKKLEPAEEEIDGMHIHRLGVRFEVSYRLKLWAGLPEAIRADRPALVHVYSHDAYARPAAKVAREMGVPLLITTYGPFESHSDYGALQRLLFRLYDGYITPSLFGACSVVLARYPELLGWLESLGVEGPRARVEPSGIPKAYLTRADARKGRDKVGHEGELILYVGRVSPQKGVQHAVAAMEHVVKRFPRAKLAIAGPDYIEYSKHLRKLAVELGVEENVLFLGPVTLEGEEGALLSACDVLVMPSSFEGFSQSVMKAMAQGRPVVVTNVGGLPFEVDYGRCGLLCEYGDAKAMADELIAVLESPEEYAKMAELGKKRAKEFTFDRLAQNLSTVYRSAIAR